MISPSLLFLVALLFAMGYIAGRRGDGSIQKAWSRFKKQVAEFLPRMVLVIIGTGFLLQIIPSELISENLGRGAGLKPILIGGLAGMLVPAGPAVAFTTAATLAGAGASEGALVAFITAWCIFAIHRILIYETSLAGPKFLLIRCTVALPIPFIAGTVAHYLSH